MAAAKRTCRTPKTRARKDWAAKFLTGFRDSGLVTEACKLAAVGRSTVYERRAADEVFAAAWEEIEDELTEQLEREARRRAAEGTLKPVFHQGEECGAIREFSDTLMIFLLKARRPGVYRDNVRHEHVGAGGGPIGVRVELDAKQRKALGDVLRTRPASSDGD